MIASNHSRGGTVVIGAGAIGLTMATAIASAERHVTLVARGATHNNLKARGIERHGALGSVRIPAEHVTVATLEEACASHPDMLIVAVRAPDVARIATELAGIELPDATCVLVTANGFGVTAPFRAILNAKQILRAVVTTGATRVGSHAAHVSVHGAPVAVGPATDAADRIATAFSAGGLPARAVANIDDCATAKALLNCCVNAPATVTRTSIGDMVATDLGRLLLEEVLTEAWEATVSHKGILGWLRSEDFCRHVAKS